MSKISTQFFKLFSRVQNQTAVSEQTNTAINLGENFITEESNEKLDTFGIDKTTTETTPETNKQNEYPDILNNFLLQNRKFDISQFNLNELTKLFPIDKYIIEEDTLRNPESSDESKIFNIFELESKQLVISINNSDSNTLISTFNKKGQPEYYFNVDSDGKEIYKEVRNYIDDSTFFGKEYIDGENVSNYKFHFNSEKNATREEYDTNGIITKVYYFSENNPDTNYTEEYENGIAWKRTHENGETEYPIVTTLIKSMEEGLPSDGSIAKSKFITTILDGITTTNVAEIIQKYKDVTNTDLIDDIMQREDLSNFQKNELSTHLHKIIYQQPDIATWGTALATDIYKDVTQNNCKNLDKLLKYATRDSLKYILTDYKQLTLESLKNTEGPTSYAPSLLHAIFNETSLSIEQQMNYLDKIIQISLEGLSDFDKAGTMRDLSESSNDLSRIEVDILRALNKTSGDMRNVNIGNEHESFAPNGVFDKNTKQGQVGDCWLLAAMNSLIHKPILKAALEELYEYDETTGNATVTLNGTQYTITKEELENSNNLSSGDGDMRSFEIAMDKSLREQAFFMNLMTLHVDDEFKTVDNIDINGNFSSTLFYALFGLRGETLNVQDAANYDYNDERSAYTMSLGGNEKLSGLAKDENNNEVDIIPRHAYSIIGSDVDNIYLLNPWDSSKRITVSRENFAKLDSSIEGFRLRENSEIAELHVPDMIY